MADVDDIKSTDIRVKIIKAAIASYFRKVLAFRNIIKIESEGVVVIWLEQAPFARGGYQAPVR